jgi:hypothetical protein
MTDRSKKQTLAPTSLVRKDGSTAPSYGPARGYSWPSAGPCNLLALKHGAYSERIVVARAAVIREELLEHLTRLWLSNGHLRPIDAEGQSRPPGVRPRRDSTRHFKVGGS